MTTASIGSTTAGSVTTVTSGASVTLLATDDSTIGAGRAGGIAGASERAAAGAAISYNLIQNTVQAYIDNATVTAAALVGVTATSSPVLIAATVGAAGTGEGFAAGGTVTVNSIANDVDAHISDSTVTATGGSVSVIAVESAIMVVVAGALAISLEGAAVGGAIAYNYIGGSFDPANPNLTAPTPGSTSTTTTAPHGVSATITGSKVKAGGTVTVKADFGPPPDLPGNDPTIDFGYTTLTLPIDASSMLVSVAISGAGAQGVSVAGSINLNFLRENVAASISGDSNVTAGTGVYVDASDSATVVAVAGGLAVGIGLEGDAGVAVGLSAAINDIANTITADVDESMVTAQSGPIQVAATEGASIYAWAFGGAFGGGGGAAGVGVGAAGAGSGNTIANQVEAYAQDSANLTADAGNISILATDTPTITANGGGVAIGVGPVAAPAWGRASASASRSTRSPIRSWRSSTTRQLMRPRARLPLRPPRRPRSAG